MNRSQHTLALCVQGNRVKIRMRLTFLKKIAQLNDSEILVVLLSHTLKTTFPVMQQVT